MNTKTLYFMTRIAFVAVFAMGLLLVPAFNSTGTVSAQRQKREIANLDMIGQATNLRSASSFSAFAEDGITDNGNSILKGDVGVARASAEVKGINGGSVKGSINEASTDSLRVKGDVSKSFSIINQLPCAEITEANLGGQTFGPGVYCLATADLAGEMVLDARGDDTSTFIFVVAGAFNAAKGSSVSMPNGGLAANVFFVSNDTMSVGEGSHIKGNLMSRGSIEVKNSNIEGRALSLTGDIALTDSVLAPQVGVLEICKALDTTQPGIPGSPGGTTPTAGGDTGLENNVFLFDVAGQTVPVIAGQCSGQIVVSAGSQLIQERADGRGIRGIPFNPNFQLVNVFQNTNLAQQPGVNGGPSASALQSFNLPLRQATVLIRDSDPTAPNTTSDQTRITFVNRSAIVGIIEICKTPLDSGVNGAFQFTVNGLTGAAQGTTTPAVATTGNTTVSSTGTTTAPALQVFNVFTNECSGPITVTVPASTNATSPSNPPRTGVVTVNELLRNDFIFTSASTAAGIAGVSNSTQINRFINFQVFGASGQSAANTSGGTPIFVGGQQTGTNGTTGTGTTIATSGSTTPIAGNATAIVVQASGPNPTSNETIFFFNNRTQPGQLKVCKIAGPGIAEGTDFTFTINGTEPLAPVAADTAFAQGTNPLPSNGITPTNGVLRGTPPPNGTGTGTNPGAVPQGGTNNTRQISVSAGLPVAGATFPPSGGGCQIVPTTYVVDTPVRITEFLTNQVAIFNANGTNTGFFGDPRLSRVTSSTGILANNTNVANVNPVFNPTAPLVVQPNTPFFPLQGGSNTGQSTVTGTDPQRPNVVVPIRRGLTEVEFVNVVFSPVPLKICKVAATAAVAGQVFTFRIDTADQNGTNLFAPFSSTVTVTAQLAGTGTGAQNGGCVFASGPFSGNFGQTTGGGFVNGASGFNFNSQVLITELPTTGFSVMQNGGITSPTSNIIPNTIATPTAAGTALIVNMINGVNEVQFINVSGSGGTPAPTRRKKLLLSSTVTQQ